MDSLLHDRHHRLRSLRSDQHGHDVDRGCAGALRPPYQRGRSAGIPLGVFIGILAIGLAAFSLIMDFTSIEEGVRAGAPERYSWVAAFGLTVTLVWLYVEIIRLLAILRGDD
jgi:hypothetical protein